MLVDAAPRILPEIPTRLGEYAARQLAGRGVEIHVSTPRVRRERGVHLSDSTRSRRAPSSGPTGARANPLLAELWGPARERGRAIVDAGLRVDGTATSGHLATARPCQPGHAGPDRPADLPARSPRDRRLARNLTASRSRTATACSARRPRSDATRESPRVGPPPAGIPGPVLHALLSPVPAAARLAEAPRCRSTGRWRSSSAGTSPSSGSSRASQAAGGLKSRSPRADDVRAIRLPGHSAVPALASAAGGILVASRAAQLHGSLLRCTSAAAFISPTSASTAVRRPTAAAIALTNRRGTAKATPARSCSVPPSP